MKVVHIKKEPYDVYIGRPSKWGNPFAMEGTSAIERYRVIEQYREWIKTQPKLMNSLHELKGKILGCWCAPKPCHGEILLELANRPICVNCNDKGIVEYFDNSAEVCKECRIGWNILEHRQKMSIKDIKEFTGIIQPRENTGRCVPL